MAARAASAPRTGSASGTGRSGSAGTPDRSRGWWRHWRPAHGRPGPCGTNCILVSSNPVLPLGIRPRERESRTSSHDGPRIQVNRDLWNATGGSWLEHNEDERLRRIDGTSKEPCAERLLLHSPGPIPCQAISPPRCHKERTPRPRAYPGAEAHRGRGRRSLEPDQASSDSPFFPRDFPCRARSCEMAQRHQRTASCSNMIPRRSVKYAKRFPRPFGFASAIFGK